MFESYFANHRQKESPPKENKLLNLLRERSPECVSKDEIIELLWSNTGGEGSDWALNALVYRLRKHPAFVASGKTIITHKKQGYSITLS